MASMNILAPEIKIQWAISSLSRMFFLTFLSLAFEYFFINNIVEDWFIFKYGLSLIVFIILLLLVFIVPPLKYKYWKYEVKSDEIYIERGILTRVHTTAPFSRVQHIDVIQSVLDRWMGLGKLVIYTAGTKGADLFIPGLPIQYAEHLRDYLKNYTQDDSV